MANNASESTIQSDLRLLFDMLKNDKEDGTKSDTINKSTLISLMLYLDMHKPENQPEFFDYINTQIEQKSDEITFDVFQGLFLKPEIDFKNLKHNEMAQIFKIFDKQQKGSFSAEDFIQIYFDSTDSSQINSEQEEIKKKIREDFKQIADGEITPIEFYKIINMKN